MAYNVLIVDDSKTTRRIIEKALRHSGVDLGEVRFAGDGIEALELLADDWVDIVFADLNMPRMGGIELVERMAEFDIVATIPVVIVSTEGRTDRIEELFARGVAAYVRKPFSPEELASTVRTLLEAPVVEPDRDMLAEAFFSAIEGFAMLVAEPLEAVPLLPDDRVTARMTFQGPGSEGSVWVAASRGACEIIAQTATGEGAESDGCDALKELLNVTAGHFVDSLAGGPFRLSQPEIMDSAEADALRTGADTRSVLGFDVEGALMVLGVTAASRW